MHRPFALPIVACAIALVLPVSAAHAGQLDISPVSVTLSDKAPSAMIAISNRGKEPARMQISLFAWRQLPNGEMDLTPTQEVIFFPAMLTLNPKEARNIRIGTKLKPSAVERTYRVIVQELPPVMRSTADQQNAIRVLTRLAVPVFVAPTAAKGKVGVAGLGVKGMKVSFQVRNSGNAHLMVKKLILRAKNGSTTVHSQELDAWYILAAGSRDYEVELPADACLKSSVLEVELESDSGPASATITARCGG